MTEGTELSNQEKIRMLGEKKTYKHLEKLEIFFFKYLKKTRNLLETKLYRRSLIKGIDT